MSMSVTRSKLSINRFIGLPAWAAGPSWLVYAKAPGSSSGTLRNPGDGVPMVPTESPAPFRMVVGYRRPAITYNESPVTALCRLPRAPQYGVLPTSVFQLLHVTALPTSRW